MKVLVFEWLTGGGLLVESLPPDSRCPFQTQGRAMLEAVSEDLSRIDGVQCVVPVDHRLSPRLPAASSVSISRSSDVRRRLRELAKAADRILLIAPECHIQFNDEGKQLCLLQLASWLDEWKNNFISPDAEFIALTSDKSATLQHLSTAGIPVPAGDRLDRYFQSGAMKSGAIKSGTMKSGAKKLPADRNNSKLVLKPNFGAGSEGIRLATLSEARAIPAPSMWRAEMLCPGTPVSCGVICNGARALVLPPMLQQLDNGPVGRFVSAERIDDAAMAGRIRSLALRTIRALPPTRGYVGVDMVAGNTAEEDVVVEVNPRLTTSYIALRRMLPENPAAMFLGNELQTEDATGY